MEKPVARRSNIELLRIIGMLMIISHHFVVNSGILQAFLIGDISANYIYLSILNMWGPTGLNVTVLISGYFMCRSHLTIRRYCKILFEFLFYHFAIYLILFITGYETAGVVRLFDLFFEIFRYANESFISSFLIFYLFIPFINPFIQKLTEKEFASLLLLLLFVFSGLSTFFDDKVIYGDIPWFFVLYLIGAFLRMHPPTWSTSLKASSRFLLTSVLLAYSSVVFMLFVGHIIHKGSPEYFLYHCNKLGTVMVTVTLFCTFKNLKIGYSKVINLVAKTAFGVLMIHDNSGAMRQFLWRDLLHVDKMYGIPTVLLIFNSTVICLGIYLVCSLIDMVRIFTLEKWVFDHFDFIEHSIQSMWGTIKKIAFNLSHKYIEFIER